MTSAPARPATTDGLPIPQRYGAMAVILLGIAMSVLDGTIVNLALTGIARDFRADAGASVWVITAYQVATLTMSCTEGHQMRLRAGRQLAVVRAAPNDLPHAIVREVPAVGRAR